MPVIQFGQNDLDLFRSASHDANPLHTSSEYARRTPYGQPVVYGVLGAVAGMSCLPQRDGLVLSSVAINFHAPMFLGVSYTVGLESNRPEQSKFTVRDSSRLLLTAKLIFRVGMTAEINSSAICERTAALDLNYADIVPGLESSGRYSPTPEAIGDLIERWGLSGKGLSPLHLAALAWSSFLIGMELPGKRATFSRLRVAFADPICHMTEPFAYAATVAEFDPRYDLMRVEACLSSEGHSIGNAELWSIVRRDPVELSTDRIAEGLAPSESLRGRAALVTGGSRGLGAAIAASLSSQGAQVLINYRSGESEAESLQDATRRFPGSIIPFGADINLPEWASELSRLLGIASDGLHVLVCNASPPILPLSLALNSVDRVRKFVDQSLALVATPLAASLEMLDVSNGWVVLISSEYAVSAPPEFPHYVAAKRAIEGLVTSAVKQFANIHLLIVRPPRLLTDQTNSSTGREGALAVESVATKIISRIVGTAPYQGPEVLDVFDA
jgi:NAD(P)-dependent dehydrogenase (short-subunit alcohol dehydrogenase family)